MNSWDLYRLLQFLNILMNWEFALLNILMLSMINSTNLMHSIFLTNILVFNFTMNILLIFIQLFNELVFIDNRSNLNRLNFILYFLWLCCNNLRLGYFLFMLDLCTCLSRFSVRFILGIDCCSNIWSKLSLSIGLW